MSNISYAVGPTAYYIGGVLETFVEGDYNFTCNVIGSLNAAENFTVPIFYEVIQVDVRHDNITDTYNTTATIFKRINRFSHKKRFDCSFSIGTTEYSTTSDELNVHCEC